MTSLPIVEVVKKDVITAVDKTVRDGALCICVSFQSSKEKFLNLEVFSSEDKVFDGILLAYQALIGKSVRVTCWDPQRSPGRWSNSNWFKNIAVLNDNEQIQQHINVKGFCEICGIADGLLNYSPRDNNGWFHYRCKFPNIN
jgi:hypothetical protein